MNVFSWLNLKMAPLKFSSIISFLLVLLITLISCEKEIVIEPTIDESGLLTDAGMTYPLDLAVPNVTEERINGIMKYAQPIRSLIVDETFSDLEFLSPLLNNKRIVQIGESGHGVKEYNQVKVRLIKHLHQNLGYNVIAFESSLFECYHAYLSGVKNRSSSAVQDMQKSIFGVWSTREVEELFQYIRDSQDSDQPLILAGIDVQSSSNLSRAARPQFFYDVISHIDSTYASDIFELDQSINEALSTSDSEIFNDINEIVNEYDQLTEFLQIHRSQLNEIYHSTTEKHHPIVAIQTAKSMSFLFRQRNASALDETQLSIEIRDRGMSKNLEFLLDEMYPDEKVMVWAHNFHVRHDNPAVEGNYLSGYVNMGKHVHNRYGDELYTIGLFMYKGSAAANDRSLYDIEPAIRNSLESIMHHSELRQAFMDFTNIPESDETDWIFESSFNKAWGLIDMRMIPREQYDGIIFIQEVSPPNYL